MTKTQDVKIQEQCHIRKIITETITMTGQTTTGMDQSRTFRVIRGTMDVGNPTEGPRTIEKNTSEMEVEEGAECQEEAEEGDEDDPTAEDKWQ